MKDSIPSQLAKENKKFIYSVLREGARAKDFELAIQWLCDCNLCCKVGRVKKGAVPLKAYQDLPAFKLYLMDVGLLAAMVDLDAKSLLMGNNIFTEFKGRLTEQYVCQQILAELKGVPYYWSAESSSGEVDFVLQYGGKVIPAEVKAEENLNAKSLKNFVAANRLPFGVRISMSDYREQEKLVNLPLYAVSELWKRAGRFHSGTGNSKDGDSRAGNSKDGNPRDRNSKDRDSRDGDSKDGNSRDGNSKDGDSRDGNSRDGNAKDGDSEDGNSKYGGRDGSWEVI